MSPDNMIEVISDWLDVDVLRDDRKHESIEWDGSCFVIRFEDEACCPHEPGEYIEITWQVRVYLRSYDSIQCLDRSGQRIHKSVDLDVFSCTPGELLKAIVGMARSVPTDSPNQPDTPCLQDQHPNHPSFTEVT